MQYKEYKKFVRGARKTENIIYPDFGAKSEIKLKRPVAATIEPAKEDVANDIAESHTAEPIKDMATIRAISKFLIANARYRDNMLFIVGINVGLRITDLLHMRFSHLIDDNFCFKNKFQLLEQKTKNTRSVQRNRVITINEAVMDAVELYLQNTPNCSLSDYMFRSESNRSSGNEPMTRKSADRILKGIAKDLSLDIHMSTHTLRKTFGYHQMAMAGNSQRQLLLLQKIFGHSSAAITLSYIGITDDEIGMAYQRLNLGGRNSYDKLLDSRLVEEAVSG